MTTTTWDTLGASAGIAATVALGIGYAITRTTAASLNAPDADYVRVLLAERTKWEWVTFVGLAGGTLVLWFIGTLAERLRRIEGDVTRLATVTLGLGVLWSGVWLLSAFFNSASILLAANYADPGGARVAGVLARETPYVLTAGVVFALLLATSFVVLRFGGFPKWYAYSTAALTVAFALLAVGDWYAEDGLGGAIVALALIWMAVTSVLLLPRGPRRRQASV